MPPRPPRRLLASCKEDCPTMKRTHLSLAGLVLSTVLIQLGCANLPQSTTGSAPEDAQALKDHEAYLQIAGLPATTPVIAMGKNGDPLAGMRQDQLAVFGQGKAVFERVTPMEPGDYANNRSCVACHGAGGTLGASGLFAQNVGEISNPYDESVVAIGVGTGISPTADPADDPLFAFLGHLLSNDPPGHPEPQPIPKPHPGMSVVVSARLSPAVAGDGVLMAIPDSQILARQDAYKPFGIKGRTAQAFGAGLGKIGWKLRTPSLRTFTAGAFINELGMSDLVSFIPGTPPAALEQHKDGSLQPDFAVPGDPTSGFKPDLDPNDFEAVVHFQEWSAPPAPQKVHLPGLAAFKKAGCIECHWTGYTTAKYDYELPEDLKPAYNLFVGGKAVPAYTDLLAHKMGSGTLYPTKDLLGRDVFANTGAGNSDGIKETVDADEYRTPALWGLRYRPAYMHNGKAKTIDEAIRQHYYVSPTNPKYNSEANEVVLHYLGKTHNRKYDLSARERYELLTFLRLL